MKIFLLRQYLSIILKNGEPLQRSWQFYQRAPSLIRPPLSHARADYDPPLLNHSHSFNPGRRCS